LYAASRRYWTTVSPTIDGVLGGLGYLHGADVESSWSFLTGIRKDLSPVANISTNAGSPSLPDAYFCTGVPASKAVSIEVGAGIGRVTEHLLARVTGTHHLVEPDARYCDTARKNLAAAPHLAGHAVTVHQSGIEDMDWESLGRGSIHLVWCQWVLIYLTNPDLLRFLKAARRLLAPTGILILKESVVLGDRAADYDAEDASVTRNASTYVQLFDRAGLRVVRMQRDTSLPEQLYPVFFFALAPKRTKDRKPQQ
jgi:protein N-terminal methyltransferase